MVLASFWKMQIVESATLRTVPCSENLRASQRHIDLMIVLVCDTCRIPVERCGQRDGRGSENGVSHT